MRLDQSTLYIIVITLPSDWRAMATILEPLNTQIFLELHVCRFVIVALVDMQSSDTMLRCCNLIMTVL